LFGAAAVAYGTVLLLPTSAAAYLVPVAVINVVREARVAVPAPLPYAAASIKPVAIMSVLVTLAVIRGKSTAVAVGAGGVVVATVVIQIKPSAAAAIVASVIAAARVMRAVAPSGKIAVTVWPAMTLPRKSVVEMGMAPSAILMRSAVVTSGAVWRANVVMTARV
jgi:hypothetical protein